MVNNAAVEAICSATYLSNYLDTMENLPDDLQRNISQMRELHIQSKAILDEIKHLRVMVKKENSSTKRSYLALQRALIHCQEIGDEKIALVQTINDLIENRARQLDQDREHLDYVILTDPGSTKEPEVEEEVVVPVKKEKEAARVEPEKPEKPVAVKRQRRTKAEIAIANAHEEEVKEEKEKPQKKKKKRKVTKKEIVRDDSPLDFQIDPNEPTYCSCNNVSYGEMIGCDNDKCVIEWYHFACVGLRTKPKGKWYCPECRGDKPTVRRSDK